MLDFGSIYKKYTVDYPSNVRDLNEIVNRNAARLLDEEIKNASTAGRKLTRHMIAGDIAVAMGISHDTANTQLVRNLEEGRNWTANYMQGFAAALGKTPQDLISPGQAAGRVLDATVAQSLFTSLNHRLDAGATRSIVRRLKRQLDCPPLFDFIQTLTDRLLAAASKVEAGEAAMSLIAKTDVFDSCRCNGHEKKVVRKSK